MPGASPVARRFVHSRAFDLAAASPLIVILGLAGAGNVILIARQWHDAGTLDLTLSIVSRVATLLFFALQVGLFLTRHLPVAKSEGIWPRLVAIIGANMNFALLLLPHSVLNPGWSLVSSTLTIAGTLGSLAVLWSLGRAFSVFPEARHLVVSGPYRLARHPLYLMEIVSTLGVMLQFRQPWATLVGLAAIAFQFQRMMQEEIVLRRTYPEYEAYARSTSRLIPGLY